MEKAHYRSECLTLAGIVMCACTPGVDMKSFGC